MKILGIDLEKLILEAVDEINPMSAERQRQQLKADELKPFKAAKKKEDSDEDEEDEVDEAEDEPIEASAEQKKDSNSGHVQVEEIPEVTAGKLVKILNTMRSGKSLSDKQVRLDFQRYFNSLGGDDRVAFYTFLDAVNKIVTDPEESGEAEEPISPDDVGVDIKAKPKKKKVEKPSSDEDDDAPIVVGEIANKASIKRLLRRNR